MTTRRFTVYDTNPLATQMRESATAGQPVFLCGSAGRKKLGVVEATNAANAILAARDRWPACSVQSLYAVEKRS